MCLEVRIYNLYNVPMYVSELILVCILDLSKAFDKVSPSKLLHKLDYYGIRDSVLNWIKSFLDNRSHQVIYQGLFLFTVLSDIMDPSLILSCNIRM